MSETTPPKFSKTAGCFGIFILLCVAVWISDMAGCNKENDSAQEQLQQKILKEMGPDNPMAKRINSLNQNNAYGAGVTDGSRDAMQASRTMNWGKFDFQEGLSNLRTAKSLAFDALGTQNKFNPAVFDQYRRGWDYGASTLTVH